MGFRNIAKILLIGGLLIILTCLNVAQAGFGISPGKVLNHRLLPGSHFEQLIYLVRSEPKNDLIATLEIDAPEMENWISVEPGMEFIIPAGVQQFPMTVNVDVPIKAEFKDYKGQIWLKTRPKTAKEGMVTVALGSLINVDLRVSAEEVYGFLFRGLDIPKLEEGWPVKVALSLQNTGNVKNRPTKVELIIFNKGRNTKLYTGEDADLDYIKPFETEQIKAKFPVELEIGTYWGHVTAYKDDKVLIQDKRIFFVVEKGSLSKGLGWFGWTLVVLAILAGLYVFRWWRRKTQRESIFAKVVNKIRFIRRAMKMRKRRKLEAKLRRLGRS